MAAKQARYLGAADGGFAPLWGAAGSGDRITWVLLLFIFDPQSLLPLLDD